MYNTREAVLQGGVLAMADTGVKETLDGFFAALQVSPGTMQVNKLHAMCLMPLFEDLLGGKLKAFAQKDKKFWQCLMDKCFPRLRFASDTTSAMNTLLYTGTANTLPDAAYIPSLSTSYDISKKVRMVTPRVMGKYFWIAVPAGYALSRVNNLSVEGDWMSASIFKMESRIINNGHYNLYWLKARVPIKSTYQIILK